MADPADNAFGAAAPTQEGSATPPANDLGALLSNIKNENGEAKYKSLEDAIRALDHSQRYIPDLKTQLTGAQSKIATLEEQLNKFSNIEESVQRLLAKEQNSNGNPAPVAGLDEQAVMRLVQQSLQQSKSAEMAEANFRLVNENLVKKFGDKARDVVATKARELNTTPEALQGLAKENPQLVLTLFQTPAQSDPTHTTGSRNTPLPVKTNEGAIKPNKSLLAGISDKDRAGYFVDLKKEINAKFGVELQ